MAAPWETWVLLWLAALQVAAAAWWWRGPSLPRTRSSVAAAFLLNSVATAGTAVLAHLDNAVLRGLAGTSDRWADVALLAFAAVAAEEASGRSRLHVLVVPTAAVAAALALPAHWGLAESVPGWRLWQELPLLLAILLVALAMGRWSSSRREGAADAWLLALAVLGLRYAELGTRVFLPRVAADGLTSDPFAAAARVLGVVAFGALLGFAALVTLRAGLRPVARPRRMAAAPLLVAAGALIGLAGAEVRIPQTLLFLTIALARPVGFLYIQAKLGPPPGAQREGMVALAVLFAASSLGLAVGISAWGLPPASGALLALAFLLVAAPAIPRLERALPAAAAAPPSQLAAAWPLDPSRVSLPPDWEEVVEGGHTRFRRLEPRIQASLASLTRWQRILLALDAVPRGSPPNAYARTTPGIHLATHCPYAEVGSEIRRANQRAGQIARDLGLGDGPGPGPTRLVEVRWGRAEGLRSGRAKFYLLTPLGRRVAERLRDELGLPGPPDLLAGVLAESYTAGGKPAGPHPPEPRNPR